MEAMDGDDAAKDREKMFGTTTGSPFVNVKVQVQDEMLHAHEVATDLRPLMRLGWL